MRVSSGVLALTAGALLAGCNVVAQLPLIAPVPESPNLPPRVFTASITREGQRMDAAGLQVVCQLSIRQTPDRSTATTEVAAAQLGGSLWSCPLPASFTVRPNEMVVMQWLVRSASDQVAIAQSELVERMPDCMDPATAMARMQTQVLALFPRPVTAAQIMAAGFEPTHGFTAYQGMGVAFARVGQAEGTTAPPSIAAPNLLLFVPTGTTTGDAGGADDPYTLIGWAYAESVRPDRAKPLAPTGAPAADDNRPMQLRPRLACVPRHAWFFHAAGYHRPNGTFLPSASPNAAPGALIVPPPALPGLPAAGGGPVAAAAPALPGHPPFYHPNFWDVHFFRSANGRAQHGIYDPEHRLSGGIGDPPNSFYYPVRYDP